MPQVHWRWVVVGIAFIYGAQLLLAGFARILGPAVETLQGHQALFLAFTLFSFLLGGFVVGLLTPGASVVEPALAAIGAALLDALLPPPTAAQMAVGSWLAIVTTGFLLALVGGWMGERVPTPTDVQAPRVLFWFALLVLVFGLPATLVALGVPGWLTALVMAAGGTYVYWRLAKLS